MINRKAREEQEKVEEYQVLQPYFRFKIFVLDPLSFLRTFLGELVGGHNSAQHKFPPNTG